MTFKDKIEAEYSTVSQTDFWRVYLERIAKYRELLARDCETKENPLREQGGIKAIDFILGKNEQPNIAVRLLEELKKKS